MAKNETNVNGEKNQDALSMSPADRVAAAKARAEAYLAATQEATGTVLGLSAGCVPYWFVPAEIGNGRAEAIRRDLSARGYEHAPHATVSGIGTAEVWEIPAEVAAMLDARRNQRNAITIQVARKDVNVRA